MPSNSPAKLNIPVDDQLRYEFTIRPEENIRDFEKKVNDNCDAINDFKILAEEDTNLGDLARNTFNISVNKNVYKVYPDFESVCRSKLDFNCPLRTKTEYLKEQNVSMKMA